MSKQPRWGPMLDLPSRMPAEDAYPQGVPQPDNVAFFAGGTGIAPILQAPMSKNRPRGKVDVFYSVREEISLKWFLLFMEKAGRAKFHYFVDSDGKAATMDDMEREKNLTETDDRAVTEGAAQRNADRKASAVYCSVLQQVADCKDAPTRVPLSPSSVGTPATSTTSPAVLPRNVNRPPIGGILAAKGWTNANTVRMLN